MRMTAEDPAVHRSFAMVSSGVIMGLLALATLEAFLPPNTGLYHAVFVILIGLIVLATPPTVIATLYLWRIYLRDTRTRRSWLLLRDALISTALAAVAAFIAFLAAARLLGYGPYPWAIPYLVVAFLIVAGVPQYMAAVYWLRRRASGDDTPPPAND